MTFEEFFEQCEFDFWESYYSGIPYVTVTFNNAFCEYQHSQSIHKNYISRIEKLLRNWWPSLCTKNSLL